MWNERGTILTPVIGWCGGREGDVNFVCPVVCVVGMGTILEDLTSKLERPLS